MRVYMFFFTQFSLVVLITFVGGIHMFFEIPSKRRATASLGSQSNANSHLFIPKMIDPAIRNKTLQFSMAIPASLEASYWHNSFLHLRKMT